MLNFIKFYIFNLVLIYSILIKISECCLNTVEQNCYLFTSLLLIHDVVFPLLFFPPMRYSALFRDSFLLHAIARKREKSSATTKKLQYIEIDLKSKRKV